MPSKTVLAVLAAADRGDLMKALFGSYAWIHVDRGPAKTVTAAVQKLLDHAPPLLEREPVESGSNQRTVRLRLTEAGRALLPTSSL